MGNKNSWSLTTLLLQQQTYFVVVVTALLLEGWGSWKAASVVNFNLKILLPLIEWPSFRSMSLSLVDRSKRRFIKNIENAYWLVHTKKSIYYLAYTISTFIGTRRQLYRNVGNAFFQNQFSDFIVSSYSLVVTSSQSFYLLAHLIFEFSQFIYKFYRPHNGEAFGINFFVLSKLL